MATKAEPTWFITDRAISSPEDDAFAHDDIAGQLADIVVSVEAPATIGLIGGFGTGKSSVGNLLATKLRGHRELQVVTLSAEKHTGVARQRALVFSFAEGLVENAGVSRSQVEAVLGRVEENLDTQSVDLATLPITVFARQNRDVLAKAVVRGVLLAIALLVGLIVGALLVRSLDWTDENPFTVAFTTAWGYVPVLGALFGGLVALLPNWLKAAFTPNNVRRNRPRAEAADELERIFAELAGLVKKRLVIVVDDIDRLPADEVLEALGTIKTLQAVPKASPPIFIVPCDDRTIIAAIEGATASTKPTKVAGSPRTAAEEYLNKLFVVRQYLPPHLKEDMQSFADRLLRGEDLNHAGPAALGDKLTPVLQILIHETVGDPRHVIRLLNAFFADYRLAKTRENEQQRLGRAEVSGRPLLLARLTALRVDFPDVYDAIRSDFELLRALDLYVVADDLDAEQRRLLALRFPAEEGESEPNVPSDLVEYLRRTAPYFGTDIALGPFFYMGQTPAGRVLGSQRADEIRRALENNDADVVRRRLKEDPDIANAAVEHIITSLHQVRPGLLLLNAVTTAASVLDGVADRERTRLSNELANIVLRDSPATPGPFQLAAIIRSVDALHVRGLESRLVAFEDSFEEADSRAQIVFELAAERPADAPLREALADYFVNLPNLSGWLAAEPWMTKARNVTPTTRSQIIGASFFIAMLRLAIGAPNDAISDGQRTMLAALLDDSPNDIRSDAGVIGAVQACIESQGIEPRSIGAHVLRHINPASQVQTLLEAAAAAVTDDIETYDSTDIDVVETVEQWCAQYGEQVRTMTADAADTVAEAIAQVLGAKEADDPPEEQVIAAHRTLAAFGLLQPGAVAPAIAAAIVLLERHRDDTTIGRATREALVALVPCSPNANALFETLTKPIDVSAAIGAPDTQAALATLALVLQSPQNAGVVEAALPRWRERLASIYPTAATYLVPLQAGAVVAGAGHLPEAEAAEWMTRIRDIPAHGGGFATIAARGAAMIPWPSSVRPVATQFVATLWADLGAEERGEIVGAVTAWGPAPGDLAPPFAELVAALLVDVDTTADVRANLTMLWPALGERRPYVAGNCAHLFGFPHGDLSAFGIDEFVETLVHSTEPEPRASVLAALKNSPDGVRDGVAKQFVDRSFDAADIGWHEDTVSAVVAEIATDDAAREVAAAAVGRLGAGAAAMSRAAVVLDGVGTVRPDVIRSVGDDLAAAIHEILAAATPDLAERLGRAAHPLDFSRFKELTKGLRGERDDHSARAIADAFERAFKRR